MGTIFAPPGSPMALDQTCPFCNSLLPHQIDAARTVCPRCGESVTARRSQAQSSTVADSYGSAIPAQPRSSRRVVFIVGLAAAAVGFAIAVDQWLILGGSTDEPRPNELAN